MAALTYNITLWSRLSIGFRSYFFRQYVASDTISSVVLPGQISGWKVDGDFGLYYLPFSNFGLGLTLRNIANPKIQYREITQRSNEPFSWGIGFFYHWRACNFAVDLNDQFHGGIEVEPIAGFQLRAGVSKDLLVNENWTPSCGFAFEVAGITAQYAWLPHYALNDLHVFSISGSITRRSKALMVRNAYIAPLYLAFASKYSNIPPAYITLQNNTNDKIRMKVGIKIPELMTEYSFNNEWIDLSPRELRQVAVPLILNVQTLPANEIFNSQAHFLVVFNHQNKEYTLEEKRKTTVYGSRYITWDDIRKLAAFITPADSLTVTFTRKIVNYPLGDSSWNGINAYLHWAMAIYSALQAWGLKYVSDPSIPDVGNQPGKPDYIQFPGETFRARSGDCDDMVALVASCLEAVGVPTALVSVPGHIYLAFYSGLNRADMGDLSLKADEFIVFNDQLWIPIEITLLEKEDFYTAWREGIRQYQYFRSSQEFSFQVVQQAWLEYPPTSSYTNGFELNLIADSVMRYWALNVAGVRQSRLQQIERFFTTKLYASSAERENDRGVYLARMGFADPARTAFSAAIKADRRYCDPHANLANLYMQENNFVEAITQFKAAIRLKTRDGDLHFNLALAYLMANDQKNARLYLEKAKHLAPSKQEEYETQFNDFVP